MSDKTLASLTAATPATGGLIYGTQDGADRKFTLTAAGAAVLEAETAADQRAGLECASLAANTFTALQTITQATANAGVLSTTGHSLTGSNATSMLDLTGTWNTTGAPTAIKLNITDNASDSGSLLLDLQHNSTTAISVAKDGALKWGAIPPYGNVPVLFSRGIYGDVIFSQGGANNVVCQNFFQIEAQFFSINSSGAAGNGGVFLSGFQHNPNTLQLGQSHATTPTAQTIKSHDVTTGTGASLTLTGGTGSVAPGAVILNGGNRAPWEETPSITTIRDILISHGLMSEFA